jgi:hypothetical protein
MLEPSVFVQRWRAIQAKSEEPEDELCTVSQFPACTLSEDTKRFLREAGLPASCSPFLTFDDAKKLPRLWEVFSPGQWEQKLKDRVAPYVMIGSDDAGNAICLDESGNGRVVIVDHETLFQKDSFWSRKKYPSIQPMNQSVQQLAESLLCHVTYMEKLDQLGFSAISDTLPEEPVRWLEAELTRIDETARLKGSFWNNEINYTRGLAKKRP